ncbi:hypothetical protein BHM03_00027161 [Ensete ventricosum]|uniref:Uncharacterized protein n=1 Tax=Ensete ventricosum TaxID=4639 RepID=A0A445MHN9_ENSVE|nr:hypothetical protein BHM03_00027161 [Ensete ventricosum]
MHLRIQRCFRTAYHYGFLIGTTLAFVVSTHPPPPPRRVFLSFPFDFGSAFTAYFVTYTNALIG